MGEAVRTVSVALATYNGRPWLAEQLDSILAQDVGAGRTLEVVASDDGSTDGTLQLLADYSNSGAPVRVVTRGPGEAGGVTRNFDRALRATTGEVVLLSDQDDVWPRGRIAKLLQPLAEGADLAYGDYVTTDGDLRPTGRVRPGPPHDGLVFQNQIPGMTMAMRRWLLEADQPIHAAAPIHDWWLLVLALHLGRVAYVPEVVTLYRQHGGNAIGVETRRRSAGEYAARLEGRARFYEAVADRVGGAVDASAEARLKALAGFYDRLSTLQLRHVLSPDNLPLLFQDPTPRRALLGAMKEAVACHLRF